MGTVFPHVTTVSDETKERLELFEVGWARHTKDSLNLFHEGLNSKRCKKMSEEFDFLDTPFAFARIDSKSSILEELKCFTKDTEKFLPFIPKQRKIVNVNVEIFEMTEEIFHGFLGSVGRNTEALGEAFMTT